MLYISYFFDDVRICLFFLWDTVYVVPWDFDDDDFIFKKNVLANDYEEEYEYYVYERLFTIPFIIAISSIVMNVKKNTHTIQSTILNMYLWPCVVPLSFSCFERHKLYVLCTYIHHLPPNHCIHFCIVLRDSNNKKKSLGEESIFVWKEVYIWNYIQISSMIREITIWIFSRL